MEKTGWSRKDVYWGSTELAEKLNNAIIHGVLGIQHNNGRSVYEEMDEVFEKRPQVKKMKVRICYAISPKRIDVTIEDPGKWIKPRDINAVSEDETANIAFEFSRGEALSRFFKKRVLKTDTGTTVILTKSRE